MYFYDLEGRIESGSEIERNSHLTGKNQLHTHTQKITYTHNQIEEAVSKLNVTTLNRIKAERSKLKEQIDIHLVNEMCNS